MSSSTLFWLLGATTLFWSLGAYNRLVRLRAQVRASFVAVGARMSQYAVIVAEQGEARAAQSPRDRSPDDPASSWAGLLAASAQFDASLRMTRKHSLDAKAVAALKTAHAVLQTSWERQTDQPSAMVQRQWGENMALVNEAVLEFDQCVQAYNAAIAQFPALLLALLFSFQPGGSLGTAGDARESVGG